MRLIHTSTDASVIAESRDDPERFSVIFDRYFEAIHRYAAARLGYGAADDIASGTFLAAFDQRHRYDVACPSAKAWLYGIATNLIGRHRRDEIRLYRALGRAGERGRADDHAHNHADPDTYAYPAYRSVATPDHRGTRSSSAVKKGQVFFWDSLLESGFVSRAGERP